MNRPRKMALGMSIALVAGGIGYLALGNFGQNLVYFFTPSEVVAFSPDYIGKKIRVGGMVVDGSMEVIPKSLKIRFELTDGLEVLPVLFEGIPPDLFKEGQGAVVEGYWNAEEFRSHMIMAKHSEDYMPIELKQAGVEFPKKDLLKSLQQ